MIGKIHCWLIRQFGGKHRWSHAHVYSDSRKKRCSRCGLERDVRKRTPKVTT